MCRAVAVGLSDRDGNGRYALYVASALHLGLENTLVRPGTGTCSYGHQIKICIENYNVAVVVVVVVF